MVVAGCWKCRTRTKIRLSAYRAKTAHCHGRRNPLYLSTNLPSSSVSLTPFISWWQVLSLSAVLC